MESVLKKRKIIKINACRGGAERNFFWPPPDPNLRDLNNYKLLIVEFKGSHFFQKEEN